MFKWFVNHQVDQILQYRIGHLSKWLHSQKRNMSLERLQVGILPKGILSPKKLTIAVLLRPKRLAIEVYS